MDPRQRFSDRVRDYVRYRPAYPAGVLAVLGEAGLEVGQTVVDLGSGTGILTRLLLAGGYRVIGVEPNAEMRAAAEALLAGAAGFTSAAGSAEDTGLARGSVDGVVAAQAFHWFDPDRARAECLRILRPGGVAAMIWNNRRLDTAAFLRDYDAFLRHWGTDYADVSQHYAAPDALARFFGAAPARRAMPNAQALDLDGLRGRLLSCSYIPGPEHPERAPMLDAVEDLFAAHQRDGVVTIDYLTEVFYGPLTRS